ncbi:replication initiation protein RepC [Phaeobacter gallaeciensis]|uniref:replication initiation protein RepC n=1 Tax=Phaeobacter gallaeciensis TaxID=60890 RepID=UPI00237F99E3|nr:replication initiation protein RepC [Phaeobacter gallaeciensis]MDE4063432.1 replication initiation protein RepC [Phaeobacter gallaeciensis]MDE4126450.1 replication initiation protein RepC [Phaeobacter gallaeciensis]MDE4130930.1 replication initiation protein RepC [Phaeobacter gallaeciensis]
MHVSQALPVRQPQAVKPTLPPGMERDGFVALVDAVASSLGVGAAAMMTFRTMIASTRPSAFKRGPDEPCCYLSQNEIARKRGVTACRIREHEKSLVRAGLIEKRTMANGARSGFSGCGIFFGLAIARVDEFLSLRDEIEADRRTHARLRGLRSSHKRHLKGILGELIERQGLTAEVERIQQLFSEWRSGQALNRMSLDELQKHEAEAEALTIAAADLLTKTLDRPLENERSHIQDTTQDPKEVLCNDPVDTRSVGKPTRSTTIGPQPDGRVHCLEKQDGAVGAAHKSKFIQNLGSDRLYGLCSEEMQMWLDIERSRRGRLDFYSFVIAAQKRLPELGIHPSAWKEAVRVLDEDAAMLCVLITDAKVADPEVTILSAGGYLRGMIRAHRTRSLNIMGSLIGLNERNRGRH